MPADTPSSPTRNASVATNTLALLVAFVMIAGGGAHLASPAQFTALVPRPLPAEAVIAATGVMQLLIGFAALWPRTRRWGALAFTALCVAYLPLHLWDYIRPDPVFAPPMAATVRVIVQCGFIAAGWLLARRARGT
jgi:uncharacterized membrane protein